MPIKFRCEHCKQLIGIAEIKAGSLVDCPTCGRTLRVPNKDGTVEPLPKPRVNLADDGLRRALDELAQMDPSDEAGSPSAMDTAPTATGAAAPSESRPTEPPLDRKANSVALEPLPPMKVVDPPTPRRTSARSSAPSTLPQPKVSPEQVLAEMAVPPTVRVPLKPPSTSQPASVSLLVLILTSVACLIIGAAIGFVVGRNSTASTVTPQQKPAEEAPAKAASEPAQPQISGRVTYRDSKEKSQPDSGACVVLLPTQPDAEHKLSMIGFRPSDDDATRQAAISRLEEQGGRLVQTDDDGQYQIDVPGKGEYQLLVLSHFQGQAEESEASKAKLDILAKYFDRPSQLVGKLAFEVRTIKHSGSGDVTWDHSFGEK